MVRTLPTRLGAHSLMAIRTVFILTCLIILLPAPALSKAKKAEINCLECHSELEKGKSVHPAVSMGCASCHTAVDATNIPHRFIGKTPKGLSAEQPELCYGCHDKTLFTKRFVHAAVGMGCTGCHNPHASDAASLLVKSVVKLCTTCHEEQASGRHIVAGFAPGDDHPVKGKNDPSKPSRELSCISCHNPHSSAQAKLLVNETARPASICHLCHKKIGVITDRP